MSTGLVLHNTLSRRKEPFKPLHKGRVGMYVCGPTVYDFAHIGNARPIVVFDTLYRLLKTLYDEVTYVRNITDVDDKIIKAAAENGEPIEALTERTIKVFHEDMTALKALPPDIEPRATQHIDDMIALIEKLVESGHAYESEGQVLFHVPFMSDYGRLSRCDREEMIAGARVEVASYKKDPADFLLWKPSNPDQPGWNSPWGRGRPGWHVECSAMSATHLGDTFDIHGGGLDLVFPHHENEIAQSRCAHDGAPFVRYWVHNGYVIVEGEKMSKSLGNFFTVRELLEEGWPGEVIRLTLLSAHYRQPLDFTRDKLKDSKAQLDRLYGALRRVGSDAKGKPDEATMTEFRAALLDDLNVPLALSVLHETAGVLNKAEDKGKQAKLARALFVMGEGLGLLNLAPEAWFKEVQSPAEEGATGGIDGQWVEDRIAAREAAREGRDFPAADCIRDELAAAGVVLEDGPDGTTWRRAG
ncbi:MAG: cysteine--tRNA ligase [Alphaproteobacteria bacterium]|nr:cysteine--tRNA ligase [Rhodospirillaceae bacterium]MDP6031955.1 cysteine--tRNA ligase [Alphaproteobacteria bacterium]MDP7183021.1 cysteine--tRNA ligase [Alphaproteobacteria bacterium]HJO88801.1 cysteine--tRNA ligase [Alphaproteobacteria bacterium]